MDLIPKQLTGPAVRLGAAAQNALEVARFGGLATDEEPSPYEVASEQRVYRLRHYYPDGIGSHPPEPPVLLVPPMMLAAEVYDVSPGTSAVTVLREHGVDPWVVDFGAPEKQEGDSSARSPITCWPCPTRSTACTPRPAWTSTSVVIRRGGCSATRPRPTGGTTGLDR